MRWFTSDLHLGHERIIDLCHRPFRGADHMNQHLISRWNAVVGDEDTVWILGDLAMGTLDKSLPLIERCRGQKVLVPGNHDRVHPMWMGVPPVESKIQKYLQMQARYRSVGLKLSPYDTSLFVNDQWVGVNHFPPEGDSHDDDRYERWRPKDVPDRWVIHGHVHEKWKIRGRWINVGVDVWDFTPVPESIIVERMVGGPVL